MTSTFGFGPLELVLLLTGIGSQIPIGMPTGMEDPQILRVAPAECLFLASWASSDPLNPSSANNTEKLLAEAEVQEFIKIARQKSRTTALRPFGQETKRNRQRADVVDELATRLFSRPGMLYVANEKPSKQGRPDVPMMGGIFSLGDSTGEVRAILENLNSLFDKGQITTVEIGGQVFYRAQPFSIMPVVTWGVRGKYGLVAVGHGEMERLVQRARGPVPDWLTAAREEVTVPRVATFAYVNTPELMKLVLAMEAASLDAPLDSPEKKGEEVGAQPKLPTFGMPLLSHVAALSLQGLGPVTSVTGLDNKGAISRTVVKLTGTSTDFFARFDTEPLSPTDVKPIPQNSPVAIAFKLDVGKVITHYLASISEFDPEGSKNTAEWLEQVGEPLGVDLRKDLLASFGDTWRVYANADAGGLLTGCTISAPVVNPEKLKPIYERFLQMAEALTGGDKSQPGAPAITKKTVGTMTLYTLKLSTPGLPIAPSWCLRDKELLIGSSPVAVEEAMKASGPEKTLANQPELARYFQSGSKPLAVAFFDTRQCSETLFPLFPGITNQGQNAAVSPVAPKNGGREIVIPRMAIEKHLQPSASVLLRTDAGLELIVTQTAPAPNLVIEGFAATGAFISSAIQQARAAGRRSISLTVVRSIIIGLHGYARQGALPPAYTVDGNGKPLLSWRVHILPYVGEDELYKKFRLDEPWDSDHNKAFVPMMPRLYRALGSNAEEGKTNYLGVQGKDGVFIPAQKALSAVGIRLAQIKDGISNTAVIVEVNDEAAVIWTKPGDFDPDVNEPLKVLVGLRSGGFIVGLMDGTVRFLPETIPPKILQAIFTKAGREVVDLDELP